MSILSNPKLLYFVRLFQLIVAIAFLVLVCWAGTHRAWWSNIDGPLAIGVITSIFTFVLAAHTIFTHHRSNPFSGGSKTYTIARLTAEVLVFLLWIASAGLMLKPRHGCENKAKVTEGLGVGREACWEGVEQAKFKNFYSDQPIKAWDSGIALSLLEAITFLATIILVFLDDRKSKVSGGTSYA